MTRWHFKMFADEISKIEDLPIKKFVADLVARVCLEANPNFSKLAFLFACGLVDEACLTPPREND